jgi:acyl-CoA thioesterase FadM
MSLSKRIAQFKTIASIASLLYLASSVFASRSFRQIARSHFSPWAQPFRLAALVVALFLNAKSLPLVWHLRFFKGFLYQTYLQPKRLPRDALFRPIVTTSLYTPTNETDFNGHKSNSTYFSDLDVARTQHIACLLSHGIRNANAGTHPDLKLKGDGADGSNRASNGGEQFPQLSPGSKSKSQKYLIALGSVNCNFKREIKPYERFDIWTRILSWDEKWVYQVSHIVKPGAVLPDHLALQAWRTPLNKIPTPSSKGFGEADIAQFKEAIFATSISKYVVKRGRQTIPPELVLQSSHLLPPKSGESPNENSKKPVSGISNLEGWTWEAVEEERKRGMELAAHLAALDGLQNEFPVSGFASNNGLEALGQYRDMCL